MRPQNAKIFHAFKMSLLTEQNLQHNRLFVLRPSIPLLPLHYSSIVYASNVAFWKTHLDPFFGNLKVKLHNVKEFLGTTFSQFWEAFTKTT